MAFQFQCPYGHLLEGDESQAGQQCQCPMCQTLFIIPAPLAPAAPPEPPVSESPPPPSSPFPGGRTPAPSGVPRFGTKRFTNQEPEVLHIPCPNGHLLETPVEMLDQDVLCPQCQVQFRLRRRDSEEFKRRKEQEAEIKEIRTGNAWFHWAVVVAVLVLVGLLFLILASTGD